MWIPLLGFPNALQMICFRSATLSLYLIIVRVEKVHSITKLIASLHNPILTE